MVALLKLVFGYVCDSFRSQEQLKAEIILLRHQLNVLRRKNPRSVRLRGVDRALFVGLYRLFPGILNAVVIVKPETVVGWHRAGFRAGIVRLTCQGRSKAERVEFLMPLRSL